MNDYILLMRNDAADSEAANDPKRWEAYLTQLRSTGRFDGGSEIAGGERIRKGQAPQPCADDLGGYLRVRADSLEGARQFLAGNPVYEAGGTVELRELPRT